MAIPLQPVMVAGQHQPGNLRTALQVKESLEAVPAARIGVRIGKVTENQPQVQFIRMRADVSAGGSTVAGLTKISSETVQMVSPNALPGAD